eukprot:CAMPEP_0169112930 /NCGR_PEP_ID=MMETSP1015-20121227/27911_1 /TAXON_ID=342587 /ORGANISM="Karlodinium micrum, Strain CCMP2283" /LENGTH=103 /DNA_ID=CAMNT_0009175027 /DNA_START=682 /DNA_END=993 /DNA_ORIENTATION=+
MGILTSMIGAISPPLPAAPTVGWRSLPAFLASWDDCEFSKSAFVRRGDVSPTTLVDLLSKCSWSLSASHCEPMTNKPAPPAPKIVHAISMTSPEAAATGTILS